MNTLQASSFVIKWAARKVSLSSVAIYFSEINMTTSYNETCPTLKNATCPELNNIPDQSLVNI